MRLAWLHGADPIAAGATTLYQFGALGVIGLAALWFAWRVYGDLMKRIQQLHEELAAERERNADLERDVREKVVPLLTDVMRYLADVVARGRRG